MKGRRRLRGVARAISRRQYSGQIVNIAAAIAAAGANPYDDHACRMALTKAGYPPMTIFITLRAAQELVRDIQKEAP